MKKIILIVLTAPLILLSGCGKQNSSISESTYNPFANYEAAKNEQVDAMFGYGLVKPAANGKLKYSKNMSLDFWIENAGSENNFGFMLYVDGLRQDFSIDGGESSDLHIFDVAAGERKTFTVDFEPVSTQYSDTLSLNFALIFDPKFTPDSQVTVLGNRHNINFMALKMTDVSEDITLRAKPMNVNSTAIPNKIKQEFVQYDESGNVSGNRLEEAAQLQILKVGLHPDDSSPNSAKNSDKIEVQLLGGNEQIWRVSMYVDHKLVPAFSDSYYADMMTSSNTMSSFTVDMSALYLPDKQYSSLYCIAMPEDGGYPIKSPTMIYVGQEDES